MDVQLQVAVPQPGRYALVLEYATEDAHPELGVTVHTPQRAPQQGVLTLHPCLFRWAGAGGGEGPGQDAHLPTDPAPLPSTLCRAAALDGQQHLAVFHLDTEASVQLTAERARFFLVRPCAAPRAGTPPAGSAPSGGFTLASEQGGPWRVPGFPPPPLPGRPDCGRAQAAVCLVVTPAAAQRGKPGA